MNESINRRQFIQRTAAATIILGFPWATRWADAIETTEHPFDEALKRMKADTKPGAAIIFPEDAGTQDAVGYALERTLRSDSAAVHRVLCEAVFVCLHPKESKQHLGIRPLPDKAKVVCLAPDGKPVDTVELLPPQFAPGAFELNMAQLIEGSDQKRLHTWADAQRTALGKETAEKLAGQLRNLGHDKFDQRETANRELQLEASRATAILTEARLVTRDPEVQERLDATFNSLYKSAASEEAGIRLPYGVTWIVRGGCGGRCSISNDGAQRFMACGMARVSPEAAKYLRFVTAQPQ